MKVMGIEFALWHKRFVSSERHGQVASGINVIFICANVNEALATMAAVQGRTVGFMSFMQKLWTINVDAASVIEDHEQGNVCFLLSKFIGLVWQGPWFCNIFYLFCPGLQWGVGIWHTTPCTLSSTQQQSTLGDTITWLKSDKLFLMSLLLKDPKWSPDGPSVNQSAPAWGHSSAFGRANTSGRLCWRTFRRG